MSVPWYTFDTCVSRCDTVSASPKSPTLHTTPRPSMLLEDSITLRALLRAGRGTGDRERA